MKLLAMLALVLGLGALTAKADPLEPTRGYFIGCDAEGSPVFCYVNAAGFNWAVSQDTTEAALFDQLQALPWLEPVEISGDFVALADSSADLVLTGLTLPAEEDLYVGNLRAMQGVWQPKGEEAPFTVEIAGMDWLENDNAELSGAYMISVGETCADGVAPGGMAISLYRYGDDPEADACWQLEAIEGDSMILRDFKGSKGQVEFLRLPDAG